MTRPGTFLATLLCCCVLAVACNAVPDSPEHSAAEIAKRISAGDLDAADERLRTALERWPENSRLRELQGDLDLQRGFGMRAQAAYERAIRGAPGNRQLQVKAVRSLLAQERYREVVLLAEPADDDPPDVVAGFALLQLEAGLDTHSGEFREQRAVAESLWREAANGGPELADVGQRLRYLAARHEAVEAGRQHAQCHLPLPDAASASWPAEPGRRLLRVGPGEELTTPGAAAAVAGDGDIIEIDPTDYREPPVVWSQDSITLRGRSGRPRLSGSGDSAIWVFRGRNATVENVEFAGGPASAVRLERAGLTVRNSVFRGSPAALATPAELAAGDILLSRSELDSGGDATGEAVLDVGRAAKLTVEFSYIHGARLRTAVRSLAARTVVRFSQLNGGNADDAGVLMAFPRGGVVEILGNELRMGRMGPANPVISFGAPASGEGPQGSVLVVAHNTFFAAGPGRTGVRVWLRSPATVANNVFAGRGVIAVAGRATEAGNFVLPAGLADPLGGDLRLAPDSPAIDAAVDGSKLDPPAPVPEFEYLHPRSGGSRSVVWKPDAGAHEFCATVEGRRGDNLTLLEK